MDGKSRAELLAIIEQLVAMIKAYRDDAHNTISDVDKTLRRLGIHDDPD